MKKQQIFPYELIGEDVEIVSSTNAQHVGISGRVVDETKATLVIEVGGKGKTFLKNNITLKLQRRGIIIPGAAISRRSEDRVKG